jgi:hypothetical protein
MRCWCLSMVFCSSEMLRRVPFEDIGDLPDIEVCTWISCMPTDPLSLLKSLLLSRVHILTFDLVAHLFNCSVSPAPNVDFTFLSRYYLSVSCLFIDVYEHELTTSSLY